MSEIQIDHEAVKELLDRLIALKQGIGAAESQPESQAYKNSFRNACENHIDLICRAYLDMVAQRDAERARVEALAGLVESAYQQGYEACSKNSVSPTESWPHTYNSSDAKEQLTTIMKGRTTHAQGDAS